MRYGEQADIVRANLWNSFQTAAPGVEDGPGYSWGFAVELNENGGVGSIVGGVRYKDSIISNIYVLNKYSDDSNLSAERREAILGTLKTKVIGEMTVVASPLTGAKLKDSLKEILNSLKAAKKIVINLSNNGNKYNKEVQPVSVALSNAENTVMNMIKVMDKDGFSKMEAIISDDVILRYKYINTLSALKESLGKIKGPAEKLGMINEGRPDIKENLTNLSTGVIRVYNSVVELYNILNLSSSAVVEKDAGPVDFVKGGIDFTARAMKIGLEPMGSFAGLKLVLPEIANSAAIDLDNEFKQIQAMASVGIRPSDNRILEFAAACYYRGEFGPRLGEITACLQQAHFLDERLGRESSEALRLATMLPEVFYSYSLN